MKKILLAALAAIAVTLGVTDAWAQATAPHWAFVDLRFRNHAATQSTTGDFKPFNDFGTLDAIDSTFASGIAKFDTTTEVSTAGWAPPAAAGSGVDSVIVARLIVFDANLASVTLGRTSATAESIYIKTQVSPDKINWFDCAVIPGQAPVLNAFTVQTTVNAAVVTFVLSQNTGISGKLWSMGFYRAQAAAGLRAGVDINHINEFPFVRWILMGSRSLNHSYKARVGFYTSNQSLQP